MVDRRRTGQVPPHGKTYRPFFFHGLGRRFRRVSHPIQYPCHSLTNRVLSGFVAYVLTTLPASSLHNATFRIQGERTSLASIGALYEERSHPVPVVHVTELPEGFVKQTFLQSKFEEGRLSSGWDNYTDKDVPESADSGNKVWEGHKWKTVKEVLGL